jgi:hypothetical protein
VWFKRGVGGFQLEFKYPILLELDFNMSKASANNLRPGGNWNEGPYNNAKHLLKPGCWMAKIDLKDYYFTVILHRANQHMKQV